MTNLALSDYPKPGAAQVDDVIYHQQDTTPPDGGYGWVCVGACFAVNCFTWGTVSVSRSHPLGAVYDTDMAGLWHLSVALPRGWPLSRSIIVGLRFHRWLQLLHCDARRTTCHRTSTQIWYPQNYDHRCAFAVQRLHCCFLCNPSLAVASISGCSHRRRHWSPLYSKSTNTVAVVREETQFG